MKGLPQARLLWPIRKNLGAPNRADAAIAKPSVQISRLVRLRSATAPFLEAWPSPDRPTERVNERKWKGWLFAHV